MNADFHSRFITNTDDTGRFIVSSQRTGIRYYVEPVVTEHTPEWGSIDPATGNLTHKKGDGKYRGGVSPSESIVNEDAVKVGVFAKVHDLGRGVSPHQAIDYLDAQYPTVNPAYELTAEFIGSIVNPAY
jgi:hypothetical protein